MNKKLFLFDCDETLWFSRNKDYISRLESNLFRLSTNCVKREADQKLFYLKDGVKELFEFLSLNNPNLIIGIVSDNQKKMVIKALKLFRLWKNIDPEAVNIKPWKGFCPKEKMIMEILAKKEFRNILPENIYWFDDKDYKEQATEINVNFIQISSYDNLFKKVQHLL